MARPGWPGVAACDAARPGQGRSGVAGVAGPGPGGWRGKSTAGSSPGPGGPPAQLGQTGATDLRTWKCHSRNSFYDALLANRTKKAKNISGVHSSGETGRRFSPQVQLFVCAVCEGSDNWPSAVLAAGAVSLFRARHLRPKLEKSRSWAPGAVIQQRPEGGGEGGPAPGPEKVTDSRGHRLGLGSGPGGAAAGSRAAAGSYLSCFSGSSACSGRWLALPQSQLLSRGCLPHCTRPGAPRPARLAAGREETGAGPIRAAVVGGAGRGSRLGRRAGGQPGRKGCSTSAAAGRAAQGRDPLLEGGPHFLAASSPWSPSVGIGI